jgi:hypothetical protein
MLKDTVFSLAHASPEQAIAFIGFGLFTIGFFGSRTPSLKTTTPSSTPPAPLGESSSPSPKPSHPSGCATGLTSVSRYDPWYQ